jgi:hypothetical protein
MLYIHHRPHLTAALWGGAVIVPGLQVRKLRPRERAAGTASVLSNPGSIPLGKSSSGSNQGPGLSQGIHGELGSVHIYVTNPKALPLQSRLSTT